jgi:hypothetical protein
LGLFFCDAFYRKSRISGVDNAENIKEKRKSETISRRYGPNFDLPIIDFPHCRVETTKKKKKGTKISSDSKNLSSDSLKIYVLTRRILEKITSAND